MARAQEAEAKYQLGNYLNSKDAEIDRLRVWNNRLRAAMREACDLLAERTYGCPSRSAGHNARLMLESALKTDV